MCVFMGASVCPRKTVACVGVSGHYVRRKSSAVCSLLLDLSSAVGFSGAEGLKPHEWMFLFSRVFTGSAHTGALCSSSVFLSAVTHNSGQKVPRAA